jgi:hypothetical protein
MGGTGGDGSNQMTKIVRGGGRKAREEKGQQS